MKQYDVIPLGGGLWKLNSGVTGWMTKILIHYVLFCILVLESFKLRETER